MRSTLCTPASNHQQQETPDESDHFESDHDLFRASVREFVEREISPGVSEWEEAGIVDKQVFRNAGRAGMLGMAIPEKYDGGGVDDFRFNAVIAEELMRSSM
jgi:long-chain-acyl-CoA dehydrogenase